MPHPIYGPADVRLERVRITVHLPSPSLGRLYIAEAHGESSSKRGSLWDVREVWTPDDNPRALPLTDWLAHLALVTLQDVPTSQRALDQSLRGQGWEDVPLPY